MKGLLLTLASGGLLLLSFGSLMSICMWGCPNTGIQLFFKVATALLAVVFAGSIYFWYSGQKAKKVAQSNEPQ